MDLETLDTLNSILGLFAGFVDFIVAVVMLGLAFTVVKKAHPKLGYALGGVAGLRFLGACCGRVGRAAMGGEVDFETMSLVATASGAFSLFLDVLFFAALAYVVFQLAKKAQASG
ncbi:MAG: hypothetical protein AB8I08_15495 [Sandaracinaceae bacterium]